MSFVRIHPVNARAVATSSSRHVDHGASLRSFADEVLVRCVRCGEPGRVLTSVDDQRQRTGAFRCAACELHADTASGTWLGPVEWTGRRPCGYCGHQWLRINDLVTGFPRAVRTESDASCTECGRVSTVQVSAHRHVPEDAAIDPHFGLPLLLTVACRHGVVWAYNERHLAELRSYVVATLRTRQGGGNSAMFSRLPPWMKAAKHRAEIAKSLDRLQAMSANAQTSSGS